MCEVTKANFKDKLPDIEKSLKNAKFIAVDLEFSALNPVHRTRLLFDNNKERYAKLRMNLLQVVPLQIGITAFHFDNNTDDYFGEVFTFYVTPMAFGDMNKSFYFQASTTYFLCFHNFDFNKFAYLGIPYLNDEEERMLRQKLKSEYSAEMCQMPSDLANIIKTYVPIVTKWYNQSKVGDYLEIPDMKQYENFYELVYLMHKHLRNKFTNLWTYQQNGSFCVKKITSEELQHLIKTCNLEDNVLNDIMGFKHVFNLLTKFRKPIIGHNILQDLLIMMNNFHMPLPQSYSQFKTLTNQLFPTIFDTKTLYYELRSTIPREKLPEDTSLQALFNYFKDGLGRHLVLDSTAIECNIDKDKIGSYHDAGWDSYCTGYIFLRMAYFHIAKNYPKTKKFVSSEVIGGVRQYKNCVNVIRGSTSYIRIDGEDPTSTRPPWLIVESLKNEPLDVPDLMTTLSSYGCVDIKKFSWNGKRVLVAVDNYRAARDICKTLRTHSKFQVRQYNALRHSPVAQVALLSALTISGSLLLWLTHSLVKR